MAGRPKMDDAALLKRYALLDRQAKMMRRRLPLATAARTLGIGETKLRELRARWSALGLLNGQSVVATTGCENGGDESNQHNADVFRAQADISEHFSPNADVFNPPAEQPLNHQSLEKHDGWDSNSELNHHPFPSTQPVRANSDLTHKRTAPVNGLNGHKSSNPASRASVRLRAQDPQLAIPNSGSLASLETAGADAPLLSDSEPPKPQPGDDRIAVLSDGTRATPLYIWSNASRLSRADMKLILETPLHRPHRLRLLEQLGRAVAREYIIRWADATGRKSSSWRNVAKAEGQFRLAAKTWAHLYVDSGMTLDMFFTAAVEMRPKSMKFPTPAMLASGMNGRIANWVPPEERDHLPSNVKAIWSDDQGEKWIEIDGVGKVRYYDGTPGNE